MKIVLALVLVACVAVQAAPAAKKVKGVCRRLARYSFCPLNAEGKPDFKHCKGVKVCGSEKGKWEKVGDDDGEDGAAKKVKGACLRMAYYWFCPLNAEGKVDLKTCYRVKECGGKGEWKKDGDDGHEHFEEKKDGDDGDDDGAAEKVKAVCKRATLTLKPLNGKEKKEKMYWVCPLNAEGKADDKHCKRVKKCGNEKGKWVKVGDDEHEQFEPKEGWPWQDGDHKHKKCKDGDDSDEDGDHKHKRRCKHGDESGGESDGDDDDDDDEDGDRMVFGFGY